MSRSRPSMRNRSRLAIGAIAVCLALVACGSSGVKPIGAPSANTPGATSSSTYATSGSSSGSSSGKGTSGSQSTSKDATPAAVHTGPSPVQLPWTPDPNLPVDATLSPTCFRPGTLVTLSVHTKPKAGVAYIAVYSDNGNGAPKPTGNGYGGNDKGFSTTEGDYTSAFNVSLNAPTGPGRVDVIVGWNNTWGYDGPTFTVAGPDGRC